VRTLSWRVKTVVAAVASANPTSQMPLERKERLGDQKSLLSATPAPTARESAPVSA
jgi:hypothetical protein